VANDRHVTVQEIFEAATAPQNATVPLPTSILVFAHPDDEVIALGARLGRFQSAHIVHVTDGAPRNEQDSRAHSFASLEEYRRARTEELRRAMERAGLRGVSSECLGISDQEASLQLLQLTRWLFQLCAEREPEVIFTHPYEGGHPDHDACAFAVHHAVALLGGQMPMPPLIIESTFYHAGPNGMETGNFLPPSSSEREIAYRLSNEERQRKQALLECFTTQKDVLSCFKLEEERFRIAPVYDFCQPPQTGQVFYDQFPWGMTSQRFCELAIEAENALQAEAMSTCR
jgi:N-acetylglucosamine malate deacetylase 2